MLSLNYYLFRFESCGKHGFDLNLFGFFDAYPFPSTFLGRIGYGLVLPMRYIIFLTVPDVRRPDREHLTWHTIGTSIVWLAVLSYILIATLSALANMLNINSTIFGYTIGAWAASYPALWSSIVVAKQGYGDMAAGNAIGSNTFCNLIGLGLPWLVVISMQNGAAYTALQDDGVVMSLIILIIALVLFYLLMFLSSWTLKRWYVFDIIVLAAQLRCCKISLSSFP